MDGADPACYGDTRLQRGSAEEDSMRTSVICISRTVAAGGEPVGHRVAPRLGFHYFDDEVITLASEKAGLDPSLVGKAEQHSSLLTRLMDALSASPREAESYLPNRGEGSYYRAETHPPASPPKEELRRLIQEAIVEIARRGDAVIV